MQVLKTRKLQSCPKGIKTSAKAHREFVQIHGRFTNNYLFGWGVKPCCPNKEGSNNAPVVTVDKWSAVLKATRAR